MKNRLLSILTALALCLTLLPATAGAVEAGPAWIYDPGTQTLTSGNDAVTMRHVTAEGTELTIGNGLDASLDINFSGALNLSGTITGTGSTTNYTITSIGESAFSKCTALTSISLPESVTSIGQSAFSHCSSLTDITLPASVENIGAHAFLGCTSLTGITVARDNSAYCTENGVLFNKDKTQLIQYPAGNPSTQYRVPDGVTSIGDYAFSHCSSLTDITLPGSVTSIGQFAFQNCSSLPSMDLSPCTNLTSIGESAFYYCTALTSVRLPKSVTSIGESAFSNCTALTSIILPESVTSIGDYAFSDCTALTSITLPKSVTSIGRYAFRYCTALTSISLPESVTSIGASAFTYCTALTSISLPEKLNSIGQFAFSYCTSLTSITLPESVTSIEKSAFSLCSSLTSITLPESVTSIGQSAFSGCNALTSISLLSETPPTLGTYALGGCGSLSQILVPPESVEKYQNASGWSEYAGRILPRHDGSLRLTFSDSNPAMTAGSVPPTITVTLANTGTAALTNLDASLTGNSAGAFTLGNLAQTTLEAGASTTFTVTPHANLTAGTYPVTVKLTGNLPSPVTASFTLTVTDPYVPPVISGDNSAPSYSVTLPGKVTGGTVTAKKSYAEEGETFRFTVTPDAGYELASLAVTDSAGRELKLTNEGGGEYSFEMPAGRVRFDVTFRPVRTALPFADVDEGYWAHDEIAWAWENGYMSGTSATAFTPGGTVSRQQVWMILARIAGENPADMAAAKTWAVESGISDGTNPGGAVTRQQLAALLYRYTQSQGQGFTGTWAFPLDYPDADQVADYAYEALCWMTMHGVLGGMADGTLNPGGTATRAQLAVMLCRWLT